MRKRVLNFFKSNHFKLRQRERVLSDNEIKKTILNGEMSERDGTTIFTLKNIEIIADFESDVLITIVKKPSPAPAPKIIRQDTAKEIKEKLLTPQHSEEIEEVSQQATSPDEEYEIDLDEYLNHTKK